MTRRILALAGAALLLGSCESEPKQPNAAVLEQQVLAEEDAWNRAFAERDAEALAGFFADEGAMAHPGHELTRGKESLRKAMDGIARDPNLKMNFRANQVEVSKSGDMAYTRGRYLMTATDQATGEPQSSQGFYLTVWKRQDDGSWKAVEDFITPGPPLPVAERATMVQ